MTDVRRRIRARPPPATLAWVEQAVGTGARVDGLMILEGGGACALHALDVRDARGLRHPLVLKRFFREDWLAREPDLAIREARILKGLEAVPLPTPELVAVDPEGRSCDVPSVLMTRLPGRVELCPPDLESWLRALVRPLPYIHAAPDALRTAVQPYRTYQDVSKLSPPAWTRDARIWERVIDTVQGDAPSCRDRFLHRDYHPTNVLFGQGVVTAVLDWTNASHGPAAIDLGHCRLNLVQLYGQEVAERFLAIHREEAPGTADLHPYWDLRSLVEFLPEPSVYWGWRNLGLEGLTVELLRERLDEYAASLVSQL